MLGEAPVDVGQIEAVNIETYHDARKFTGEKYTTTRSNYVDAHLSMPCSVAVTLMDGEMPPRQLTDERQQDPAVHELAAKVKVVESEAMNRQYPHDWPFDRDHPSRRRQPARAPHPAGQVVTAHPAGVEGDGSEVPCDGGLGDRVRSLRPGHRIRREPRRGRVRAPVAGIGEAVVRRVRSARLRSAIGSIPRWRLRTFSKAMSRASDRLTTGHGPRPKLRHLPSIVRR